MKIKKFIICFCLFLVLFITGCKKDNENINKDFIFEDASYIYDGKVHSLALKGELSDGYSITYTNNDHSEIGKHEVRVTVSNDKTKKEIFSSKAILEIKNPEYMFEVKSFTYDGIPHSLTLEMDLPNNIEIRYENNSQTKVGSYLVKASLYNKERKTIDGEFYSTLDITLPAKIESKSFLVDGSVHSLVLESMYLEENDHLVIEYENNNQTLMGKYYVKAIVKDNTGKVLEEFYGIMTLDNPKNLEFEDFIDDVFVLLFEGDQISINQFFRDYQSFGLTHQEAKFSSYVKESGSEENRKELQELIDELNSFEHNTLSFEEQTTKQILGQYLDNLYNVTENMRYMTNSYLGSYLGMQCEIPIILAEYNFREEQDIIDFLSYLDTAPEVFETYLEFTKDQVEYGYGLSDSVIDEIIEQCENFVMMGSDNFLIEIFNNKIDSIDFELTSGNIEDYKTQAKTLITGDLTAAYAYIKNNIISLKGKATTDGALGSFGVEGKEYYRLMLSSILGIDDLSVEKVISFIFDRLGKLENELNASYAKINTLSISEKNKFYKMANGNVKNFSNTALENLFDDFKEYAKALVPELTVQPSISLKRVPEALKNNFSPAAYLLSPLDETKNESIYINPLYEDNYNYLFTTLAHEGYPGHLYQTVYSKSLDINKIRQVIRCSGYLEGWATYVEYKAYFFSPNFTSPAEKLYLELVSLQNKKSLLVQALLELYVHYNDCGKEQMGRYAEELLGYELPESMIDEIYTQLIGTPTNTCMYIVSAEILNELHDYAATLLNDAFDEVLFNKVILGNGSAPFDLVIKSVETYVYDYLFVNNESSSYVSFDVKLQN